MVQGPDSKLLQRFRHLENRLEVWLPLEDHNFEVREIRQGIVPLQLSEMGV